jgi:hypothetical protein
LNDENEYRSIEPVAGRLPSEVLGLHLERDHTDLRLFDPVSNRRLPTPAELLEEVESERDRLRAEIAGMRKQLLNDHQNGN